MVEVKRPRVAALGLDDAQVTAIHPMCGDLRIAGDLRSYTQRYNLKETDIVVAADFQVSSLPKGVHILATGSSRIGQWRQGSAGFQDFIGLARTNHTNTERELRVSFACPPIYSALAGRLLSDLTDTKEPPPTVWTSEHEAFREALVETSFGLLIAARLQLAEPESPVVHTRPLVEPVALLLPEVSNLSEWFRAFLTDIHEIDPFRVPQLPPSLSNPADWYTPEEAALAERIAAIGLQSERLAVEQMQLEDELAAENLKADAGIRRAIWGYGDELVEAVSEILGDLGFRVLDMDAGLEKGAQRHEDLRLTLETLSDWEAIVEVKGYSNGTKTNDARQIRENRERYREEKGRFPDLTIWLANPFRDMDPSSRTRPGSREQEAAAIIDAIHVLSTDLYNQWALVMRGRVDKHDVVASLTDAEPGLWCPVPWPQDT
ncbi:MAG: hypothetical protein OXG27_15560 [Chloroflexi bacterium]|nr:hypothetical protein [Chloroflexota bacterium]